MLKVKARINYLGFDEVLFKVYIEYMIILSLLVWASFLGRFVVLLMPNTFCQLGLVLPVFVIRLTAFSNIKVTLALLKCAIKDVSMTGLDKVTTQKVLFC